MVRRSFVTLLLWTTLALARPRPRRGRRSKVSNDNPARPLQMPPASTEVKEAFDDFERFQPPGGVGAGLEGALHDPRGAGAAGSSTARTASSSRSAGSAGGCSAALPPEGQAAYRLFYDAEAKKLLDEADGPAELKNLERVYSAYFPTSVGDNAADRLGDLYFELGRFDRAADCWLAVLRDRPDTDLSPALLSLKAALALTRAGRRAEFEQIAVRARRTATATRRSPSGARRPTAAELLRR